MNKRIAIIGEASAGVNQVAAAVIGRVHGVDFHALDTSGAVSDTSPVLREQPSPTGNDGDLLMDPPAKPRMINGSAKNGWKPKTGEDSREEQE